MGELQCSFRRDVLIPADQHKELAPPPPSKGRWFLIPPTAGRVGLEPAMKEEYANYLGDDDHLIAVLDRVNQSEGARGPDEWMPPDETYWCQYAVDWTEIKARWDLTMTDPPEVVMEGWEALGTATGEHKAGACGGAGELGVCLVRGSGVRGGAQVPGEPGRRPGLPEGDGPVSAGRGRGWCNMRTINRNRRSATRQNDEGTDQWPGTDRESEDLRTDTLAKERREQRCT